LYSGLKRIAIDENAVVIEPAALKLLVDGIKRMSTEWIGRLHTEDILAWIEKQLKPLSYVN